MEDLLVDVDTRGGRTVLANTSSMGRTAGVVLSGDVPVYLGRPAATRPAFGARL